MKENQTSGFAIASLIFGICSLLFFLIPFIGSIMFLLALVFGFIALVKIRNDPSLDGRGLAIAGIVMAFVSMIIGIMLIAGLILFAVTSQDAVVHTDIEPVSSQYVNLKENQLLDEVGSKDLVLILYESADSFHNLYCLDA